MIIEILKERCLLWHIIWESIAVHRVLKDSSLTVKRERSQHRHPVNFTKDLPQFNCPDGVLAADDPLVKHADPMMWVAALDMMLGRLQASGFAMDKIAGIGGDGQQHGSVYLNDSFNDCPL